MSLSAKILFKAMEKRFGNNGPGLKITEPSAREQLTKQVYQWVEAFEKGCQPSLFSLDKKEYFHKKLAAYNEKTSVVFSIRTTWRQLNPDIVITFDPQGYLVIEGFDNNDHSKKGPFFCRDTEDIHHLLNLVKEEHFKAKQADKKREDTAVLNWKKHKKIKDLKSTAITAKIKELAAEQKLTYALKIFQTKVKFLVKISGSEMFEINIPYNNFQSALQNIKTAVTALFDLKEKGITIKHLRYTPDKTPQWSNHD